MTLDFFDDVFCLNLAFEAPKRIFQRFALLHSYFRQVPTPPDPSKIGLRKWLQCQESKSSEFQGIT